jgi:hypothetical protein
VPGGLTAAVSQDTAAVMLFAEPVQLTDAFQAQGVSVHRDT